MKQFWIQYAQSSLNTIQSKWEENDFCKINM